MSLARWAAAGLSVAAILATAPGGASQAPKSPSEIVKAFYTPDVIFSGERKYRSRYTNPAKRIFELNEKLEKGGDEIGCIDFGPAVAAQDYDQGSINKTLKLAETLNGNEANVTASFVLFKADGAKRREVFWWLKMVGRNWKVSDIASTEDGWRLSELYCGQDAKHQVPK